MWEYLLFGSHLVEGQARLEPMWLDHQLEYVVSAGPPIPKSQLLTFLHDQVSLVSPMAANAERLLSPQAQLLAFGAPGEPGDPAAIEHLASRITATYRAFLDWAAASRGARVPDEAVQLCLVMSHFADEPLRKLRAFTRSYVSEIERGIAHIASGSEEQLMITVSLIMEDSPAVMAAYQKEMKRLKRYFAAK